MHVLSDELLHAARAACDEHGAALIFDEVQCGMGRTGTLWAYEQTGVRPDAMTVAKALGGGLPIGALVTGERLADVLAPGDHGSTFAGGPVVASAALAALELTADPALLARRARARARGSRAGLERLPHVVAVRGRGLMLACELDVAAPAIGAPRAARAAPRARTRPARRTLRLLPPLNVTEAGRRRRARAPRRRPGELSSCAASCRDGFELDDDRARIDVDAVHAFISTESYWGRGRARETIERTIAGSTRVVGLYRVEPSGREQQVGFARAITDGVSRRLPRRRLRAAAYRGRGLGLELVREIVERSFRDVALDAAHRRRAAAVREARLQRRPPAATR